MSGPHRVWKLPAQVDTDALAPGSWMQHGIEVIAQHCLESLRPDFASTVRPGDVIVAGPDFGIGSSREQAAAALRQLGVAAVIAPSFAGLFFRNAFNLGLLLLTCPGCDAIAEGEELLLDARSGRITRTPGGEVLQADPIAPFLLDMVEAGGLLPQLKRRFETRTSP
jgi:3-isopropylmalate/(R)-2-methylmalate dehydratase small subunit